MSSFGNMLVLREHQGTLHLILFSSYHRLIFCFPKGFPALPVYLLCLTTAGTGVSASGMRSVHGAGGSFTPFTRGYVCVSVSREGFLPRAWVRIAS